MQRSVPQCSSEIMLSLKTLTSGKKKEPKDKVFGQDVPGTSGAQTSGYPGQKLYKWPCSAVLDREWPGCPSIWVGTSRIWKNFMLGQKSRRTKVPRIFRLFVPNFALNFCSEFSPNS